MIEAKFSSYQDEEEELDEQQNEQECCDAITSDMAFLPSTSGHETVVISLLCQVEYYD